MTLQDRIVALTKANPNLSSAEIAAIANCEAAYVRATWRRTSVYPSNRTRIVEPLTPASHAYLEREARQRAMSVGAFSRRLLNTIATSDLVTAILDDDE